MVGWFTKEVKPHVYFTVARITKADRIVTYGGFGVLRGDRNQHCLAGDDIDGG